MSGFDTLVARGLVRRVTDADAIRAALAAGPVAFCVHLDVGAGALRTEDLPVLVAARWLQDAGHVAVLVASEEPSVALGEGLARLVHLDGVRGGFGGSAESAGCGLQIGPDARWRAVFASAGPGGHALTTPTVDTVGRRMSIAAAGSRWVDPTRTSPPDWYDHWHGVDERDLLRFLALFTRLDLERCRGLGVGSPARDALAFELTALVHGREAAEDARARALARDREAPDYAPVLQVDDPAGAGGQLVNLLVRGGLARSRADARRLVEGGGVYVEGERVLDPDLHLGERLAVGAVQIRVGKRRSVWVGTR